MDKKELIEKEDNAIKKMFGKKLTTVNLNIEGFKNEIPFDVYDAYAVCHERDGHRYDMEYPAMMVIRDSEEFTNEIIDYIGATNDKGEKLLKNDITPLHILLTFAKLYVDGELYNGEISN